MPLTAQKWGQEDRWVITDRPFETLSSSNCDIALQISSFLSDISVLLWLFTR